MDNFSDKDGEASPAGSGEAGADPLNNPTRRRFSRNALASGAVLLSLGNRPAWGQNPNCMSLATLNSFNPAANAFISAPGGTPFRNENLAAEIHRIADAPLYQGTVGEWSTCPDPDSIDGVCLVKKTTCD